MGDLLLRHGSNNRMLRVLARVLFCLSLLLVLVVLVLANLYLFWPTFATTANNWLSPGAKGNTTDGVVAPVAIPPVVRNILRQEPIKGVYFGATLDWEHDTPYTFNKRLGRPSAVFQYFTEVDENGIVNTTDLKTVVDMIGRMDAMLAMTLKPSQGFDKITDAAISQVARAMAFINKLGMPILLRFAHEMNGNWFAYGQKPIQFRNTFNKLGKAVKAATNLTFLVWAPNTPDGYPYGTNSDYSPKPGTDEFKELDTNEDGQLTEADNPLMPYWPGPDYVDWIGYSSFYFGDLETLTNTLPTPNKFVDSIRVKTSVKTYDVYAMFSEKFNKPFAIFETGASFYTENQSVGSASELQFKQEWWRQVFSPTITTQFPNMRIICWFEQVKVEPVSATGRVAARDFAITLKPDIRDAFIKDVGSTVFFADSPVS